MKKYKTSMRNQFNKRNYFKTVKQLPRLVQLSRLKDEVNSLAFARSVVERCIDLCCSESYLVWTVQIKK